MAFLGESTLNEVLKDWWPIQDCDKLQHEIDQMLSMRV